MNAPIVISHDLSFADAIGLIEASDLPKAKRTQWVCALNRIADFLGATPEGIVGRWQAIAARVKKLHPVRCGVSPKALANYKSSAKAALLYLTEKNGVPGRGTPLTESFAPLVALVPTEHRQYDLRAMMRYASGTGVPPDQIDDAFLAGYLAYRRDVLGRDSSAQFHRNIANAWNSCAASFAEWPQQKLHVPGRVDRGIPPWEDFPASLRAEIDAWLDGMRKLRRLADGSRRRPAKASTLRTRLAELQAFARRAVSLGIDAESLTSLARLLDPDLVEKIIDQMRAGDPPKTSVVDLGWRLCALAETTNCLDEENLERLKEIREVLEDQRPTGMTQKNLRVVRAVMTSDVWRRVVGLPEKFLEQALRDRATAPVRAARLAQRAVGIGILTFMPVRAGNLTNIEIGTHLVQPNGPAGEYLLTIPSTEVKNGVDIECAFDAVLSKLIATYIHDFRHLLMGGANHNLLFPGRGDGARRIAGFSDRIAHEVEKEIGLRVTAHQFRHAAAATILRADPGNYEFVRRILGHKSTKTTREFYIALEGIEASRKFAGMVREGIGN